MKYLLNKTFFRDFNELTCYWAGFIAADGCLRQNWRTLNFCLNAKDIEHLESFSKDIGDFRDRLIKLGLPKNKIAKQGNIYSLRYGGSSAKFIGRYIYSNASRFLERKNLIWRPA